MLYVARVLHIVGWMCAACDVGVSCEVCVMDSVRMSNDGVCVCV